jgi:ribose 5-phosphate isomerase B
LKIALGSDHAGYKLKEEIAEMLRSEEFDFEDFGAFSEEPVDYPDIAHEVAEAVVSGSFDRAILICGAGVGMCIAANKVRGIRAALCSDEYTARVSREHNDANVLALGGRTVGPELAKEIVRVWLKSRFDPDTRHARRIAKIELHTEEGD